MRLAGMANERERERSLQWKMSDDEVVDPKLSASAKCLATESCAKLLVRGGARIDITVIQALQSHKHFPPQVEYERCSARIEAKGTGQCAGQYMDYIQCVVRARASTAFASQAASPVDVLRLRLWTQDKCASVTVFKQLK